jgi:hypothetical protein
MFLLDLIVSSLIKASKELLQACRAENIGRCSFRWLWRYVQLIFDKPLQQEIANQKHNSRHYSSRCCGEKGQYCICDLQITGEQFQNSSRCANQVPVAEQKRYGHFPYYKREPIDFKKQKLYFRHVLAISNAKIMIYLYVHKV